MTIASQTSRIGYTGDGVTTAFAVPFFFSTNSDLVVSVQDLAGIVTTKLLGTDYNLTGATLPAGGTCTFVVAPTTGFLIAITRVPPITQTTSYNNNDPFPAKSHENALDKATTIDQYLKSQIDRAILVAPTDTPPMTTLPPASARALKNLSFDALGNPSVTTPVAGTIVSSVMIPVVTGSTLAIARVAMGLVGYGMRDDGSLLYASQTITAVSTTQTLVAANHNTRYTATVATTFNLPKASAVWDGYSFWVDASGGDITIVPNAADNIDSYGAGVNFTVPQGARTWLTGDGAASGKWFVDGLPWLVQKAKSVSGTYNITRADNAKILRHDSGAFGVLQFPAAANLPSNFRCLIINGETAAIGKGVGGTDLGSFTEYPGQAYLVINDNGVIRAVGGKQIYRVSSVALFGDATLGSDNALIADGLASGARAKLTQAGVKNQLYGDFDHNGSQPVCTLTGSFLENITFGGQPMNCGVFFWNGASPGAYTIRQVAGVCMIIGDGAIIEMTNVFWEGNGNTAVGIQMHQTAILDILSGCTFGNFNVGQHIATDGAGFTINVDAGYTISNAGNANTHMQIIGSGLLNVTGGITITINGGPSATMATWFTMAGPSLINMGSSITFSGSPVAGAKQWTVAQASYLSRSGNTIPGSVPGTPAAGVAPAAGTGWVS